MYSMTSAYKAAKDRGDPPLMLAVITTYKERIVLSNQPITQDEAGHSELGVWDGTYTIGDGGYFNMQSVLLRGDYVGSFGSISQTLTPQGKDLIGSLSQTEIGSVSLELIDRNGELRSRLSTDHDSFIDGWIDIKQGFQGLNFADFKTVFSGIITEETPDDPIIGIVAEAKGNDLFEPFVLPKAGRYTYPANEADVLPVVYGDLTENTPSGTGVLQLSCINTLASVYALACHPLQSEADGNSFTFYDDDGVISSSEYAVTTSGNYESQGYIAYVTFSVAPTGNVTGVYKGKADDSGTLITNPVDVIEDFLMFCSDSLDLPSTDTTSFVYYKGLCNSEGYTAAGIMNTDQAPIFWLNAIAASFLMDMWTNTDGNLAIRIDSASAHVPLSGVLREDPETFIKCRPSRTDKNLCNQVQASYAASWVQVDKRFSEGANAQYFKTDSGETTLNSGSQLIYDVRLKTLVFDWTRNEQTVNTIQTRITDLYGYPLYLYDWEETGFKNIHVEPGDFVVFSYYWRTDENGNDLQYQIGRVTGKTPDYDSANLQLSFVDTGEFYSETPGTWDGTYSVGDGGRFNGDRATSLSAESAPVIPDEALYLDTDEIYLDSDQIYFEGV